MALTKISTDTINLSSDTTALKMPKGTTAERPAAVDSTIGETRENTIQKTKRTKPTRKRPKSRNVE